jgi:SNF family Na+-dependent transporter
MPIFLILTHFFHIIFRIFVLTLSERRSTFMSTDARGSWGSRFGFVLAAAGSAVGLGHIWRFPYVTGENGGAAFVILYIGCVFLIGVPILFAELALGRHSNRNPVGAIKAIAPTGVWKYLGYLGVATGLFILSYYTLIAGWTFGYIFKTLLGNPITFDEFSSNSGLNALLYIVFLLMSIGVVYGGVQGGIERWSKILMPVLPVILIFIIIYSLTLPGAMKGVSFYLRPDFSEITGADIYDRTRSGILRQQSRHGGYDNVRKLSSEKGEYHRLGCNRGCVRYRDIVPCGIRNISGGVCDG